MSARPPNSFRLLPPPGPRGGRAFSLVEVVMALGILSFSLVTTLGLMSVGLKTVREAVDTTTSSLIVQNIASQARFTAYTNLDTQFSGRTFYYDEEGSFLTNSPASAPAKTRYWVTTALSGASFPGAANATTQSPVSDNLRALSIQIVATPPSATAKATAQLNFLISNAGS